MTAVSLARADNQKERSHNEITPGSLGNAKSFQRAFLRWYFQFSSVVDSSIFEMEVMFFSDIFDCALGKGSEVGR
jgi:hypothetical protein